MIINTGNRTDIPAYYSEWFYNRIDEGFVFARNPYNPQQVTRYLLDPEVVDCIAFCTKNPRPMIRDLKYLSAFNQFWAVTITPYGSEIEPGVPPAEEVMESFKELSDKVGRKCISWRYDPIFLTEKYNLDFHLQAFERMVQTLEGYTDMCVISFIDLYDKTKKNFPGVRAVGREERMKIGEEFVRIGADHGIRIYTCGEGAELESLGADCSGCLSKAVLERAIGMPLDIPKTSEKSAQTREECSCILGADIGAYNTCGHGCLYCYANYDEETVKENMEQHDVYSPFLIGDFMDGDVVKSAEQESWIRLQLSMEDLFK